MFVFKCFDLCNANKMPKKYIIFVAMKKMIYICAMIAIMLSCAKTPDFPSQEIGLISFQRWMEINAPDAQPLDGHADGDIYIEYLERGGEMPDSLKIKDGMWFYAKYTGYTLPGTSFVTRDSTTSRIANQWVKTTHWVADFLQYRDNGVTICPGIQKLLPRLNMGDHVRVYLSTWQAFSAVGFSFNEGYKGETEEYTEFPCWFDFKMGKTLSDPAYSQSDSIHRYAKNQWNQTIADTIFKDVYIRKIIENPTGDSIGQDTTVAVWYSQIFLDKFLITTNSDSIAKVYDRYVSGTTYNYETFKPNSETQEIPQFFLEAVKKMRRGETAEFLIPSYRSKQGNIGDFSSKPQVLSYEPTIYKLQVLTKAQIKHEINKKNN